MTTAPAPNGSPPRPARPVTVGGQVRTAALATSVVGLVAVGAGLLFSGSSGAAGAAVGFVMVLAFFGMGTVVVNAVASVSPGASMLVALLTYTLEVVLVGVVFAALQASGALDQSADRAWAGGSVIAATLVWLVSHIVSATRSRQPLYDLPGRPSEGPEASAR
jgi:ATP synthase protein I